jgi:hypothetical protein
MGASNSTMEAAGAELLQALTHGATAVSATILSAVGEAGVVRRIDCALLWRPSNDEVLLLLLPMTRAEESVAAEETAAAEVEAEEKAT